MKAWVLTYFSIGSGTHPVGMWDGHPSVEQIMEAADLPREHAETVFLEDHDDYNLFEQNITKGEG